MRASSYARISTKAEIRILENQRDALARYIDGKEWTIKPWHRFEEVKTSKGITPVLEKLLRLAEGGAFDVVVFMAPSRMTRGGIRSAFNIIGRLEDIGVQWRFVDFPNLDSTEPPESREIVMAALASTDRWQRERISRRVKDRIAQGLPHGAAFHKLPCRCKTHKDSSPGQTGKVREG